MRFMKQGSSRVLPIWLIPALVGVVMVFPLIAYLALRQPPAPRPAVVVSICRDPALGMRRVGFDVEFDVPEAGFDLRTETSDMPPQISYCVSVRNRTADTMDISGGPLGFEVIWRSAWPVFSERVDPALASGPLSSPDGYHEMDVRNVYGRVVGKDRLGYFKNGERWRLVTFSRGERVGYPPTPPEVAQSFDQIISSACFTPAPSP